MIDRREPCYIPVCDCCGDELPEEYDFQDAVDAMKSKGWRIVPPSRAFDYWSHYCPACAGKSDFE